jgi:hypothetical protein
MWFMVRLPVVATVLNQNVAGIGDMPSMPTTDAAVRNT